MTEAETEVIASYALLKALDAEKAALRPRGRIIQRVSSEQATTDHGALTGLTDNDHPQYLLATSYSPKYVIGWVWTSYVAGALNPQYIPLIPLSYSSNVESNVQLPIHAGKFTKLTIVTAMGTWTDFTNTIKLRKNGADTALSIDIPANAGTHETYSVTADVSLADGDLVNYVINWNVAEAGNLDFWTLLDCTRT